MSAVPLRELRAPLAAAIRLLEALSIPYVVIGGIAVTELAQPRYTADIDMLAILDDDERIAKILSRAPEEGLQPRLVEAEAFARTSRVLLLEHGETNVGVDISLGLLPFEQEAVQRAQTLRVEGLDLRLPTVEDLVIMKAVAHRPKDLQDIRSLLDMEYDLDRGRIERTVREFAELLETPMIWEDLRNLLASP